MKFKYILFMFVLMIALSAATKCPSGRYSFVLVEQESQTLLWDLITGLKKLGADAVIQGEVEISGDKLSTYQGDVELGIYHYNKFKLLHSSKRLVIEITRITGGSVRVYLDLSLTSCEGDINALLEANRIPVSDAISIIGAGSYYPGKRYLATLQGLEKIHRLEVFKEAILDGEYRGQYNVIFNGKDNNYRVTEEHFKSLNHMYHVNNFCLPDALAHIETNQQGRTASIIIPAKLQRRFDTYDLLDRDRIYLQDDQIFLRQSSKDYKIFILKYDKKKDLNDDINVQVYAYNDTSATYDIFGLFYDEACIKTLEILSYNVLGYLPCNENKFPYVTPESEKPSLFKFSDIDKYVIETDILVKTSLLVHSKSSPLSPAQRYIMLFGSKTENA
jgi:hypothetical protein